MSVNAIAELHEIPSGDRALQRLAGDELTLLQPKEARNLLVFVVANGPALGLLINRAGTRLAKHVGWKGRLGEALVGPMLFLGEDEGGTKVDADLNS